MERRYTEAAIIFNYFTTIAQFLFFAVGLYFCKNDPPIGSMLRDCGFNFHKIRYPLVLHAYHFYGCHTRLYETKGSRHTRETGEPQSDCKAIVPFRKSNPFLAVTIDDDQSF